VYVVRLGDHFATGARDELMTRLQGRGIESAPYFPSIHLQPHHRERLGHDPGDFPVCEGVSARTLALPFFHDLTDAQIRRVADALKEALPRLPRSSAT
jgi:perosamine synthetase